MTDNKAEAAEGKEAGPGEEKDAKGQDGEDISGGEDPSCDNSNAGGHRFENMIKSMLARLELHNSLAPIQEYGRH